MLWERGRDEQGRDTDEQVWLRRHMKRPLSNYPKGVKTRGKERVLTDLYSHFLTRHWQRCCLQQLCDSCYGIQQVDICMEMSNQNGKRIKEIKETIPWSRLDGMQSIPWKAPRPFCIIASLKKIIVEKSWNRTNDLRWKTFLLIEVNSVSVSSSTLEQSIHRHLREHETLVKSLLKCQFNFCVSGKAGDTV